ncbi:MAG: FAD-dependent oxidoreductase [Chloroflexi bacterium]|nr:FAD-dependent oxidoreductase [Chloroflexota bacterium]
MHDLIVLGGGPAGLTATMYAIQKRLDVRLITRNLGGKTNYHLQLPFIERHMTINGDEIINRYIREIEYLSFVYMLDQVNSIEKIHNGYQLRLDSGESIETRALIIAVGSNPTFLNVPGEKEFMMRGLSYSAISYAQLFIHRDVAVVGCGSLALRSVFELARFARKVTLIAEDGCDVISGPLAQPLLAQRHVEFLLDHRVKEIKGDSYARSIVVTGPEGDHDIDVDGIFIELNLEPRSKFVSHLVDLDESGFIKVNERNESSAAGIFAAGDITGAYCEQVLIAIGEGAKAALSAYDFLLKLDHKLAAPSDF